MVGRVVMWAEVGEQDLLFLFGNVSNTFTM